MFTFAIFLRSRKFKNIVLQTLNGMRTTKLFKFPTQLCFESMSNGFSATESSKVFLNGNVLGFSVDYSLIEKSEN